MSYEIVSVDLKDDKIDEELRSLLRKAFNMEEPLKKGHLYLNTFAKKIQRTNFIFSRSRE